MSLPSPFALPAGLPAVAWAARADLKTAGLTQRREDAEKSEAGRVFALSLPFLASLRLCVSLLPPFALPAGLPAVVGMALVDLKTAGLTPRRKDAEKREAVRAFALSLPFFASLRLCVSLLSLVLLLFVAPWR